MIFELIRKAASGGLGDRWWKGLAIRGTVMLNTLVLFILMAHKEFFKFPNF